jgi:hypothetical protein
VPRAERSGITRACAVRVGSAIRGVTRVDVGGTCDAADRGMKETKIKLPELAILAATRAMAGLGIGFLLSEFIGKKRRHLVGWPLFAVGALSTIPLAIELFKKSDDADKPMSDAANGKSWRSPEPAPMAH